MYDKVSDSERMAFNIYQWLVYKNSKRLTVKESYAYAKWCWGKGWDIETTLNSLKGETRCTSLGFGK